MVYPEPGTVKLKVKHELTSSLDRWLEDLVSQGFMYRQQVPKKPEIAKSLFVRDIPGYILVTGFYNGLTSLRTAVVKGRGSGRDLIRKNPKGLIINPCYSIAGVLVSN